MTTMDDLIRQRMEEGKGSRDLSDFWINQTKPREQESQEETTEEERIKNRVLYGRYEMYDLHGNMTPEYKWFLKEKEKHENHEYNGIFLEKDHEQKIQRSNDFVLETAQRQRDRHARIMEMNRGGEGFNELFERREKPDMDDWIRNNGTTGHRSRELTEKAHNIFFRNHKEEQNPTENMTEHQREMYQWRMEYKKRFGYDPLADDETKAKQKAEYAQRKQKK